jgi:carboxyl-terminal processing protease
MRVRTAFIAFPPMVLAAAAFGWHAADVRARSAKPTIFWSDDVVGEIRGLVERTYVDEVSPEQARDLFYAACKAYVAGLDPYCEFYTPDERRALEQETQGQFGGVGILGVAGPDGILVRGARLDDPAWKAGIRAGDRIVAVDGIEATPDGALLPRLRGAEGTEVRVAWLPAAGGARREASIPRGPIKIDSVVGARIVDAAAGIGYFRIERFQDNTAADARAALAHLKERGATSFVVDLRGDHGGVLSAAVGVADLFLSAGVVVVTKGRNGLEPPRHIARVDPDDDVESPLVLLVDGETASASEVLAGALQDHRRAVLVGERTYGKFLVQRIVPFERESVAVRLTTSRYYTPFGRNLQRDDHRGVRGGLVPDHLASSGDEERRALADWFADLHGLHWDLVPDPRGAPKPPADRVLDSALALLRDAEAVGKSGR